MAIYNREYLNSRKKDYLIGTIRLDNNVLLEDRINSDDDKLRLKKVGLCNVYVYSGEGPNPHFHIKGENFEACVKIYEAEFFSHADYHCELSKSNCSKLNDWLDQKNILINPEKTNWEVIKDVWIRNNPDNIYKNPPKQCDEKPDYSKMKNSKERKIY
jgi:hypothetical protein